MPGRRNVEGSVVLAGVLLLAAVTGGCGPQDQHGKNGRDAEAPVTDGRRPVDVLFEAYESLTARGWILDVVAESRPAGTSSPLPIIALRSPVAGPAVWLLAGIHGEEPAGPNAIARAIDEVAALGERHAVVLMPLLNPHGYARNWRYLNVPVYSETVDGQSVGDSSHLLAEPDDPATPRAASASSPEADAITAYILETMSSYPPRYSIDLHEDNLIDEGYVYSQGVLGAGDPLAAEAVRILREGGIPLKLSGATRFGEPIADGIIGPVTDSSIDELMSAATVLVFETPAAAVGFEQRVAAHLALVRRLAEAIAAR